MLPSRQRTTERSAFTESAPALVGPLETPGVKAGAFLKRISGGATILDCKAKETIFSQGEPGDCIFYIRRGKVKLTVVSRQGREAILGVLSANKFFGEQCVAGRILREMTVTAVEDCSLLRIERNKMLHDLSTDPELSITFISCLLSRNLQLHEELVDHFFNHSEKRLARLLLSLAHYGKDRRTAEILSKIDQETLAEMVGTTRGRISFFMNKFRKQGFIDYKNDYSGTLRVHSSLLNMLLRD